MLFFYTFSFAHREWRERKWLYSCIQFSKEGYISHENQKFLPWWTDCKVLCWQVPSGKSSVHAGPAFHHVLHHPLPCHTYVQGSQYKTALHQVTVFPHILWKHKIIIFFKQKFAWINFQHLFSTFFCLDITLGNFARII